ncbi:MAG: tetratricopeptide repeat protein [Melioribacteraceae bacterium]|nr:tetratricopeptide repeat protein [Melioribacteraceae bacterium]
MRLLFLSLIFFLVGNISAQYQDTTISKAIKQKWPYNHTYPLVNTGYPSYPLMTGYILQSKANSGDPFAQHELGIRHLTGQAMPKDTARAIYWIQQAVKRNLTAAWFNYAIMLNNGIGVDWNPFEAYNYFKAAAKNGMPEAQFIYGIFLTDNLVVNRNFTEAYYWIKKAADQNFKPAKETVKDFQKMEIELPKKSREDDETINSAPPALSSVSVTNAQTSAWGKDWELDFINLEEDTVSRADTRKYLEMILDKNSSELKVMLGVQKFADSLSATDTTGIGLINYAVSKGSPEALLISGRAFQEGMIVDENIIKATMNYIHAFRLGSRKAVEYIMKLVQSDGFFDLLKKEVDAENPDAMYVWAGLTALGLDYQLTDEQALELLKKGVEQKHIYSTIETGLCYYSGTLVEQDKEKAIEYWEAAELLGSDEAKVRVAFARIQLGSQDKKNIQVLENASEEGSVSAQAALAYCYEKGLNVKQNKAEAANLYRKAAHRGSQAAFNSLRAMYDQLRPLNDEYDIFEE